MNEFNIEEQWLMYLRLMKLDINLMPEVQITETKRAFVGGISQSISWAMGLTGDEEDKFMQLIGVASYLQWFWDAEVRKDPAAKIPANFKRGPK
jgi:hypothetical protein